MYFRSAVYVVLVAVLLAVGSEWTGYLPYPWYFISILWGPWAVAAFVGGRLCRGASAAVVAGIAVVGLGLVSDAAYRALFYGSNSVQVLRVGWRFWAVLAALVGGVLGAAGVMARREGRWVGALGWSIGVGVVLGEAATIIITRQRGIPPVVATIDVAIGAAMSFVAALRARVWIFLGLTAAITTTITGLLPLARRLFPVF